MRLLLCALRLAGAVVAGRCDAVVVGAERDGAGLVAHVRGGRCDPVVIRGCSYLKVGWLRWVLTAGPEEVTPRTGPIGAGLANCLALEKWGMAPKLPPLPGGFALKPSASVMHATAVTAAKIVVFI